MTLWNLLIFCKSTVTKEVENIPKFGCDILYRFRDMPIQTLWVWHAFIWMQTFSHYSTITIDS